MTKELFKRFLEALPAGQREQWYLSYQDFVRCACVYDWFCKWVEDGQPTTITEERFERYRS